MPLGTPQKLINLDRAHKAARREWALVRLSCEPSGYDPMRFVTCDAAHGDPDYPAAVDMEWIMHALGVLRGIAEMCGLVDFDQLLHDAGCLEYDEDGELAVVAA